MTDTHASQRAAKRDSLFLRAELHDGKDGRSVGVARIRNLSATGLMAETDARLAEGDSVHFTLRGVGEVRAFVSWCRDGRIGLAFEEPIDPMAVRRPVSTGASTIAEPYRVIGEPFKSRRFPRG